MPQISREELLTLARDKFGRELTDAELKLVASPLPSLAQVADRLLQWQSRLGDTEPATTFYILPKGGSK
jgi:hypothetical protein